MNAVFREMNSDLILTISVVALKQLKSPDTWWSTQWPLLISEHLQSHTPAFIELQTKWVPLPPAYTHTHWTWFNLSYWTLDKCKDRNIKKYKMSGVLVCRHQRCSPHRGLIQNSYMVAMALCWRSMLKQCRLKVEPRSVKLAMVFMQAFHTESEHTPGSIPAFLLALRLNLLENTGLFSCGELLHVPYLFFSLYLS